MLFRLQTLLHFIPPILHSFSFWDLLLSIFYKKICFCLRSPLEPPVSCLMKSPSFLMNSLSSNFCQAIQPPRLPLSPASKFAAYKSSLENKPALCHKPCPPQHCLLTPRPRLQSWNHVLQDIFADTYKTERSCNSTAIFITLPFQGEDNLKLKQLELGLSVEPACEELCYLTDTHLCHGSVPRCMCCQGMCEAHEALR